MFREPQQATGLDMRSFAMCRHSPAKLQESLSIVGHFSARNF